MLLLPPVLQAWPVQSQGVRGAGICIWGCASSHTSLGLEGSRCQVWEEGHSWGWDPLP